MTEIPTYVLHTGDGATKDFTFPFAYIEPEYVTVAVDGVVTAAFSLIAQNTVRMDAAPANGAVVRIYRETPGDALVTWKDGTVILGRHLNRSAAQSRHIAEEARGLADEAYNEAASANEFAAAAAQSAAEAVQAAAEASNASAIHAQTALDAANSANSAKTAAQISASASSGSATIASNKASEASASATRAENAALLIESGFHMHEIEHVVGLQDALDGKSASSHDHDGRYYTEGEVDTLLAGKAASSHDHDGRYYTEGEVDTLLAGKANSSHTHSTYESAIAGKQSDLGLTGKATVENIRAGTADKAMEPSAVWSAAAFQTLTQASTIAVNFNSGWNCTTVMTGDRTLGTPQNLKPGQSGVIEIYQDSVGTHALAFASGWRFVGGEAPDIAVGAYKKSLLFYVGLSDGTAFANLAGDVP